MSLDVNPSITYTVNRFDTVLQAEGMNEDGKKVLSNMELKGKKISEALRETLDEIGNEGYLSNGEPGGVVITTYSENEGKSAELQDSLESGAQDELNDDGIDADVEVVGVGRERVLEARSLGVTPGKLNLVEKLQESSDDPDSIILEEWLDRPVKDIMKQIKENRKNDKASDTSDSVDEDETEPTESPAQESASQDPQIESQSTQSPDNGKDKDNGSGNGKDKDNGKKNAEETAAPTASVSGETAGNSSDNANGNSNKGQQDDNSSQNGNGQSGKDNNGNNGKDNKK